MKAQRILCLLVAFLCMYMAIPAQTISWPEVKVDARPASRWWWMGSAVDRMNLTFALEDYARAGMRTMEITPVYGVKGNESKELKFLSPEWMEMFLHTQNEASRLGMRIDMNMGAGQPLGGPQVEVRGAACKVIFKKYKLKGGETLKETIEVDDEKQKPFAVLSRVVAFSEGKRLDLTSKVKNGKLAWKAPKGEWHLIAVFFGRTLQEVKHAAPGGEGYVMDYFSKESVADYLARFDKAFDTPSEKFNYEAVKRFYKELNKVSLVGAIPTPHTFFCDSYGVYEADWTPVFLEEFAKRRGYKLEMYLPEFLNNECDDTTARIISDYRETMAELLRENFTEQWTEWAHKRGSKTRNQAHGFPGNLIDLYAAVDIPQCEGLGISDYHIKGLRTDCLIRPNGSDISMLKYASSAAHIAGKPYTSSETLTWLTNHFRTSLSQCKPDLDLMFLSGVNHAYFHGTTYSPKDTPWPGWKFCAPIDMSPTNNIWNDAPAFFDYVARCQSFLQLGKPDNDFLVYMPIYDIWHEQDGRMFIFDAYKMDKRAPKFVETVRKVNSCGYDMDYISDNFIRTTRQVNGQLLTKGGTSYKAIIIPAVKMMPDDVLAHLIDLARSGAKVIFMESYPESVPGYYELNKRKKAMESLLKELPDAQGFDKVIVSNFGKGRIITGSDYEKILKASDAHPEPMKVRNGLQCIRRSNENGYHYFIASLQPADINDWIPLAVDAASVMIFDPLTGESGKAKIRKQRGHTEVWIDIKSGQSLILKTFTKVDVSVPEWKYTVPKTWSMMLDNGWKFYFEKSEPIIGGVYEIGQPKPWTECGIANGGQNMGVGIYTLEFDLPDIAADDWILDLGDVRESARVRINGTEVCTLWSVPFMAKVGRALQPGKNKIEIAVANLSANRIADFDRKGVEWRIFKEVNIRDANYRKDGYAGWDIVPSGLMGTVRLIPVDYLK